VEGQRDRGLMIGMLALVLLFQTADIIVFSMAMGPIQTELKLSDAQLGLVNGSAFALFYAIAAVPLARFSDRGNRRIVIATCLAMWSFFTALTSLAVGFESLFAARLLVGIGEAGVAPAALSLIAARYPAHDRAAATSWVQAGKYTGMVIGLLGAGIAISALGWRHTFLLFGLPGIGLAVAFLVLVQEPEMVERGKRNATLKEALNSLREPATLHLICFLMIAALVAAGVIAWSPLYYQRTFGMSPSEVGAGLGLALGLGTVIGTVTGGVVCSRLPASRPAAGLELAFWTTALNAPLTILAYVVDSKGLSLVLLFASTVSGAVCIGPLFAALQTLTPAKVRATAIAFVSIAMIVAGQGLGPLVVGAISDLARVAAGNGSLRLSLIIVTSIGIWPLFHAWRLVRLYPVAAAVRGDPTAAVEASR
jgi:predicted MFS family arabinose efflux permease